MNKKQELAALEEFITKLEASGPTYIGPWLRASQPSIEQALFSDIDPSVYTMTMADFHKHIADNLETNRQICLDNLAAAEKGAERKKTEARLVIQSAYDALNGCIKRLQDHY